MSEIYDECDTEEVVLTNGDALRWYQIAARNQCYAAMAKGKYRILVVLPTGTGKTNTCVAIASGSQLRQMLKVPDDRKIRVLFVAHRHRLLSQAEIAFSQEMDVELIVQTSASAIPEEVLQRGFDLVVIDEAHHEACTQVQMKLEYIHTPIILLTATDERHDGLMIKYDVRIEPLTREQAVREGWLSPTSIYSFVDSPTKNKVEIVKDILNEFASMMDGTMIFMRTKKEVLEIQTHLIGMGYKAIGLLSQSDTKVNEILNAFSRGEVDFVINCQKIGEGVDVKGCSTVVIGRTLDSYSLLNQLIGRASRPDSKCQVFEIINPLSPSNLDSTRVVGEPEAHYLYERLGDKWIEHVFNCQSGLSNSQLGIA